MKFTLKETKPTAEVEFETADGVMKFEVAQISRDGLTLDYSTQGKLSAKVRAALADAIVGWNLDREDGTPWPCDAATKAQVVPQIVNIPVKAKVNAEGIEEQPVEPPADVPLGILLFNFAVDPENFLKN